MNVPQPSAPNRAASFPADLRIRLVCQSVSEFLDQHAPDVSRGGIFVRHPQVLPVGQAVRLNLQLANGTVLLAGEGTVFWTREADPTRAESEPGMGIRFTRLTNESQRMLTHLLTEKAERERFEDGGGSDFDEDERTVVATEEELRAAAEGRDLSADPVLAVVDVEADFAAPAPTSAPKIVALPPPFAHAPAVPAPAPIYSPPTAYAAQSVAAALDSVPLPPPAAPVAAPPARISAPILPVPAAAPAAAWEIDGAPIEEEISPMAMLDPLRSEGEPEFTDLVPRTRRGIGVGIAVGAIAAAAACFFLLRPPPAKPAPAPMRQAPALIAAPVSAPTPPPAAAEPAAATAAPVIAPLPATAP